MRRFTFFFIVDYPDGTTTEEINDDFSNVVLPEGVESLVSSSGTAEHFPIQEVANG